MNALISVVEKLQGEVSSDPAVAVATIVNTRGPAYRRPGARMIIRRSGATEGSISAGCLEKDVVAHCQTLQSAPLLLTYDGSTSDDILFGLKLGCDGLVQVLVEPLTPRSPYLDPRLLKFLKSNRRLAAVTIFHNHKESNVSQGLSMCLTTGVCDSELPATSFLPSSSRPCDCQMFGKLPSLVEGRVKKEAEHAMAQGHNIVLCSSACGTIYNALLEVVEPTPSLLICGSGPDAQVLSDLALKLGWHVTVTDYATRLKHAPGFESVQTMPIDSTELTDALHQHAFTCAVVMSHDIDCDKLALDSLLREDLEYTGVIGPTRRTNKMLAELAVEGTPVKQDRLARLFSPAGLDIGADSPEEIGLSVLAEIKTVLSHQNAGFLRDKKGPIHTPVDHVNDVPEG
ncbi:MAG TPA: XdhC family protein, partial [Chroococcales cyanobacterium]